MRTAIVQYMTFLCLMCMVVTATGTAQDPLALEQRAEPYYAAASASAPQDQPEVKKRVNPWYPTILKAAGIEGEVWLKVFINEKGIVEKVEAVTSTNPAFVEAAIEAVKQWEFSPAKKDGKPIKAEVTIPFRFKLADGSVKSKDEDLLQLEEDVRKLLRGDTAESVKGHISADAYAVVGNTYEYLSSLFSDKAKRDLLIGGRDSKVEMSHSIVGDAGDMAYMVIKTRPAAGKAERYHTVVFVKTPDGTWKISAWHAGS